MKTRTIFLGTIFFICSQLVATAQGIQLSLLADNLTLPTDMSHAGDGSGRLFILEKSGTVKMWNGSSLSTFLDISSQVYSQDRETSLLGIAFHPDFESNGYFFLNYTTMIGNQLSTRISRLQLSEGNSIVDPSTESVLLEFAQPYSNHNGGALVFGDDGYLYIATGDGGSSGDPQGNAQNLETYLGKILRIDVNGGNPYSIPPDNPFSNIEGALEEIYAYGLRNPWKITKDRETGEIWVADVGQFAREEINILEAGANYGWKIMEGTTCYNTTSCDMTGLTLPVYDYARSGGNCSVTGGYVYRGSNNTFAPGHYIFSDYCSGRIWSLDYNGNNATTELLLSSGMSISSFGEDESGELYIADYGNGNLYRIAPIVTSIEYSKDLESQLQIFPNPASGSFKVSIPEVEKVKLIELYDAKGSLVIRIPQTGPSPLITFNRSEIGTGLFTLKVLYHSGFQLASQVVIE